MRLWVQSPVLGKKRKREGGRKRRRNEGRKEGRFQRHHFFLKFSRDYS
jgi:hypothetical protein